MFNHSCRSIPRQIAFAIVATLILGAVPQAVSATTLPDDLPDVVRFGDTGLLSGIELTVSNVDANADELLHTFDPTMPYVTDIAYVMVQIEARNTRESEVTPDEILSFSLVLDMNHTYDLQTSGCDRWPMPPDAITIAPGETARFNLCFIAPLWLPLDSQDQLIVHTLEREDVWPIFFALDVPQADCACVEPTPKPTCLCVEPAYQGGHLSLT